MGKWSHYLANAFWCLEFITSVYGFVLDWRFSGTLLTTMLSIPPSAALHIFGSLATVGLIFLIYHNIVWFSRRTKRHRFYELRSYVHAVQSSTRETRAANIAIFKKKVAAFKVPVPKGRDTRTFENWFPEIAALIETKSLKEARKFDIDKFMEGKP